MTTTSTNKINSRNEAKQFNEVFTSPFKVINALNKAYSAKNGEYAGLSGIKRAYDILGIKALSFEVMDAFGLTTHYISDNKGNVTYYEKSVLASGIRHAVIDDTHVISEDTQHVICARVERVGRQVMEYNATAWCKIICDFANNIESLGAKFEAHERKVKAPSKRELAKQAKRESKINEAVIKILASNPDMSEDKAREIATAICA